MHRPRLLGVSFDPLTPKEAMDRLLAMIQKGDKGYHVMTPNAEMLVEGTKNAEFLRVMQGTALNLPDSTAVTWFGGFPARVTGVDTVKQLCAVLSAEHPVFLLGAAPGVAEKAAHELQAKNPRLTIAGTYAGSPSEAEAQGIIERINASQAHLLLVAYGAPAQDLWIHKHLHSMPSVRVAMGVGGTLDFLAGARSRAPGFMRSVGLEWLWRLIQEPRRIGRIWRAVVIFPLMVLFAKR